RTLLPPVPAEVVVRAVAAVLAVRLVVLALVRDEVARREPVVRGDEVDAGIRPAPARRVQVGRARQPGGHLRYLAGVAAPEAADAVPVPAVPFGPPDREAPHLVAAVAEIPRLGDQLDPGEDRV